MALASNERTWSVAGLAVVVMLCASTAAHADPSLSRPFSLTDLSDRSTYGIESTFGSVEHSHDEGELPTSHSVTNFDFVARVRIAPRARLLFRYGFAFIGDFTDKTASPVPARGNATVGLTQLFPMKVGRAPINLGVSFVVSFPFGDDKIAASALLAALHATQDSGLYNSQAGTARIVFDARYESGRSFVQAQAALHAQAFADGASFAGTDTLLVRAGVLAGTMVNNELSAVVELTTFAKLAPSTDSGGPTCGHACPGGWDTGPVYAPAVSAGVRHDQRWGSLGAHAVLALDSEMLERTGLVIGVDIAFADDR